MSEVRKYPPPAAVAKSAWIDAKRYAELYEASIANPEAFWSEQAKRELDWIRPFTRVKDCSFAADDLYVRWFEDGQLNVSANCLDRHLAKRADQVAITWESDDGATTRKITYRELHTQVCKLANALKGRGAKKGDRITIYMPMIPEAAVAMLACARIGAVHSVVFGGFSPEALRGRIEDCDSRVVITADEGLRGGKRIPLKANVDQAIAMLHETRVDNVIVVRATGQEIDWVEGRDHWYHEVTAAASAECAPETMGAEDPLFILYTSGSTGKPKGVLHTSGGYLLWVTLTFRYIFDYHDGDIFWCAADIGWVTGHSYIVYGPLSNGASYIMYEGLPNWPDASRIWQIVDKHQVSVLYTAPTAIRALMRDGDAPVLKTSRKSLKLLGTVGEPINPEAWEWYHRVCGENRCPIVDTWWQTETGGALITPLPGATTLKPGCATRPFFGIRPQLVDNDGHVLEGDAAGNLVLLDSWPGQMRTVYGDHQRFVDTYFKQFPGKYTTGDGCHRDADGDYWITGRVDDVLNVAGHRMGTAEVESALVSHPDVAEAAVVGCPHEVKGQGIYAYVTLKKGIEPTMGLQMALRAWVRKEIGPIATPDFIQWAPGLPKTRSGKIMRRILRKVAADDFGQLGDTSTLADPAVVDDLIANRMRR
jgi:acetyl-CoA synthetase